jgi:WG containing repeat
VELKINYNNRVQGLKDSGIQVMGKYYLIFFLLFFANPVVAENNCECTYFDSSEQDLVNEQDCLSYTEGVRDPSTGSDALITEKVLASTLYDENGLAYLYSPVGIFYFTKSGLVRRTLNYDNGPDYFKKGLARTEWNGKIGFFDITLSIVIEPQYDFAFPFDNGISIVCTGCSQKEVGEHIEIVEGKWGAINVDGELIHSVVYSKSELEAKFK